MYDMGSNVLICEMCGRQHNGEYSDRFCCESCARKFSSSFVSRNKLKEAICICCHAPIMIKQNATRKTCLCDKCKLEHSKRKCKVCGNIIENPNKHICSSRCHDIRQQLGTYVKYFGLDESKIGTSDIFNEVDKIKEKLYKDYWIDGLTSGQICQKYGYPNVGNLIAKVFKYLNIPSRTLSEAIVKNWEAYDNMSKTLKVPPQYKSEWYTTWDGREVFLRSSYETDYANELDNNKIWYDVECLRIKYYDTQRNEYRCAIPDFYIRDTNTIVEIKSYYTFDKQNMIDKFKAYHELGYNTKLILEHAETDI